MTTDRIEQAIAELAPYFGERLSRNQSVREHHAHGEGYHAQHPPQAVVFAETTEDVAHALRVCNAHRAPVIPFGAGTSLEGQVNAIEGGISIDLSRMTSLLELNSGDMDCRVQAGITRQELNLLLRDEGLFFPVDPVGRPPLAACAPRAPPAPGPYGTARFVKTYWA